MLIFIIVCYIVYIPYIYGNSITSETSREKSGKAVLHESNYKDYNKTKLSIVSEGGSVLPNAAIDIVLPKDKHNILLSLDNEMDKNKEKSVVPRKGVVYSSIEDIPVSRNNTNTGKTKDFLVYREPKKTEVNISSIKNHTISAVNIKITNNSKAQDIDMEKKNNSIASKKPLILSNEALDQISLFDSETSFPKDSHNKKVPRNPNSHPGMIMPIVITILVVPMFAVIGYLALKRGQEAWKNRHYKRMDFLLDGMYND